jgi:hypothetical protein
MLVAGVVVVSTGSLLVFIPPHSWSLVLCSPDMGIPIHILARARAHRFPSYGFVDLFSMWRRGDAETYGESEGGSGSRDPHTYVYVCIYSYVCTYIYIYLYPAVFSAQVLCMYVEHQ